MAKETAKRTRPSEQELYVVNMQDQTAEAERATKGRRLIKGKEIPFGQNMHAFVRTYSHPHMMDLTLNHFYLFTHKITTHAGRHIHQGGLTIFILKGRGYSMVEGVRHDWQAGDLLMLPIKRGGVDHQHFNLDSEPSVWLAMIPQSLQRFVGRRLTQKETSPGWKGK